MDRFGQRGGASVEYVGIVALLALLLIGAIASLLAGPPVEEGRELGAAIARKLRCAPRLPGPCWQDPLTEAYGRPVAGLVRALAPAPVAIAGPAGLPLVPVDFRRCRSETCAGATPDPRLTASNRRITAFTSIEDHRHGDGTLTVTYWLYRPGLGWDRVTRTATSADVARLAGTPLLESQNPQLIPLETLDGRNQYDWPPAEEPPWRWRIESVHPP